MLHYREFRQVYSLLDRCLQVGGDPHGWRTTLAFGLKEIFRVRVVLCGEFLHINDDDRARVLHNVDIGWESAEQQSHFIAYQVDGAQRIDPARAEMKKRDASFTATAISKLVDFDAYRQSEVYRRYLAPSNIGDIMIGVFAIPPSADDRSNLISCMRGASDPLFSAREIRHFRLLLRELAELVGIRLADSTSPVMRLTPRQHKVLRLLLEGLSEPAAAVQMGVTRGTFHKYVTDLYRLIGVRSRPELQARFTSVGNRLSTEREQSSDPRHHRVRREGAPMAAPWRSPRTFGPGGGRLPVGLPDAADKDP